MIGFEQFLDEELAGLKRYARVLAGNRDDGHDLLTEVLVRAHQRWPEIGHMVRPGAYVRRMITNQFLSEKRRWSFRMVKTTRTGVVPDRPQRDQSISVVDRADLHDRLSSLPHRQRVAVVMRYYLDFSDVEIAAELNIGVSSVRAAISRALSTLRIDAEIDHPPGTSETRATASNRAAHQVWLSPPTNVQESL